MLYMLFNEIFKEFKNGGERDNIKKFIEFNRDRLEKLKETEYFSLLKKELNEKLLNLREGSNEKIEAENLENLKDLFKAIHIIRCNLFHGDKVRRFDHRDILLIYCVSELLEEMFNIIEKEGYYAR